MSRFDINSRYQDITRKTPVTVLALVVLVRASKCVTGLLHNVNLLYRRARLRLIAENATKDELRLLSLPKITNALTLLEYMELSCSSSLSDVVDTSKI